MKERRSGLAVKQQLSSKCLITGRNVVRDWLREPGGGAMGAPPQRTNDSSERIARGAIPSALPGSLQYAISIIKCKATRAVEKKSR